jgi:hypothetical protein
VPVSPPTDTSSKLQKLSRGALYLILQNRLYRGEMTHKGNSYPGEQPAIVDKPLWDDVQAVLAANRVERTMGARARHPSLVLQELQRIFASLSKWRG